MTLDSYMSIICSSKLQIFAFGFAKQMTDVSQARKEGAILSQKKKRYTSQTNF